MRSIKTFVAGLAMALLISTGAFAAEGANLNEVGALLVYPTIANIGGVGGVNFVETFVTITNAGPEPVWASETIEILRLVGAANGVETLLYS